MTGGLLERRLPWRDGDLDRSVWAEIVAIGSMLTSLTKSKPRSSAKCPRSSAPQALVLLGDLSGLRVRAEVDERDVGKITLGGAVVVRSDSLPGREFGGEVISISPMVQPGAHLRIKQSQRFQRRRRFY
jgi:hypothetical protein